MPLPPTYKFRSIPALIGLYTKFGTDPIRRLDYLVVRFAQPLTDAARLSLRQTLCAVPGVTEVQFRGQSPNAYAEVYMDQPSPAPETLKAACEQAGVPATVIE